MNSFGVLRNPRNKCWNVVILDNIRYSIPWMAHNEEGYLGIRFAFFFDARFIHAYSIRISIDVVEGEGESGNQSHFVFFFSSIHP